MLRCKPSRRAEIKVCGDRTRNIIQQSSWDGACRPTYPKLFPERCTNTITLALSVSNPRSELAMAGAADALRAPSFTAIVFLLFVTSLRASDQTSGGDGDGRQVRANHSICGDHARTYLITWNFTFRYTSCTWGIIDQGSRRRRRRLEVSPLQRLPTICSCSTGFSTTGQYDPYYPRSVSVL
jgi:hypothetical protein